MSESDRIRAARAEARKPHPYPADWPSPSVLDRRPGGASGAAGAGAGGWVGGSGASRSRTRALAEALRRGVVPPAADEAGDRARRERLLTSLRPPRHSTVEGSVESSGTRRDRVVPPSPSAAERSRFFAQALRASSARGEGAPNSAAPRPLVHGGAERRLERWLDRLPNGMGGSGALVLLLAALVVGFGVGREPEPARDAARDYVLHQRLTAAELAVEAREGEIALLRAEMERLKVVAEQSTRYRIPMDLAGAIYDAALSEGVDPALAYGLVRVESGFHLKAISPVGAVGLTQVMPSTAYELDPTLSYTDLFRRDTNLRLGFRYLHMMLDKYRGDLRLALLAYNRGPGTVDAIRREGKDPGNGYARAVMGSAASP